jgi:hypothetical protein
MHTILTVFIERGHETLQIPIVRLMTTPKTVSDYIAGTSLVASVYSLPGAGRSR